MHVLKGSKLNYSSIVSLPLIIQIGHQEESKPVKVGFGSSGHDFHQDMSADNKNKLPREFARVVLFITIPRMKNSDRETRAQLQMQPPNLQHQQQVGKCFTLE